MWETTQQLIDSVQQLRAEYERVLAVNRQLVVDRHGIAAEIHEWARRHRQELAADRASAAWNTCDARR